MVLLVLIPLLFVLALITSPRESISGERPTPSPSPETAPIDKIISRKITDNQRGGRVMQTLYQVELLASEIGWTPDLLRLAGDSWRDIGDLRTAVSYWEAAALELLDDTGLTRNLAVSYISLGRWPEATESLRRLGELTPDDRWVDYQLGLILATYDPLEAQSHLKAAEESESYREEVSGLVAVLMWTRDDPQLPMRVGTVLAERGLWPYAEIAFQNAVTMPEVYAMAAAYLGLSRDMQGKDGGEWIEKAAAAAPEDPQVRFLQGLHLRAVYKYAESLNVLMQVVSLDPSNPAYYAEVGTAYRLIGEFAQAEYWLKQAVTVSGNAPAFQALLNRFYADEAPYLTSDSLNLFQQSMTQTPDDSSTQAAYGWALHQAGQTEDALAVLEEVLSLEPDNAHALFYKASILLDSDNEEEAVPLFQRVVALNSAFATESQRILTNLGY
jgi:tetratricopeptide (TPR) repeat protein